MLSLRYHLISLVAVFLALAVGVVLGSTTVSQRLLSVVSGDRDHLTEQASTLSARNGELQAALRASDGFATSVAPGVVKGQLDGRKVVLVVASDASPADRDAVRQLVGQAGGSVTGEVDLTDALTDPARADAVRDLTIRLLPAGAQLPSAADAGGLAGGFLGGVLLHGPNARQQATPDQVTAALAGLTQAGFIRPGAKPTGPAQLAVVLTGGAGTGANTPERAATLARLASELDRSGGAVLAGRSGAEQATGAVGVVRADPNVSAALSTVDNVQTAVGRVATVLALREQAEGRSGRYGASSTAQAPIPGASAS